MIKRNTVTTPYYLSSGRFGEVKKTSNRKFQHLNSKSGRGRLREVVTTGGSIVVYLTIIP